MDTSLFTTQNMKNLKNETSHVLIALFPGQGQINPCLQFSKQLINLGIGVTLTTSLSAFSKIKKLPNVEGLSFAPFSDGYDGKFQLSSIAEFHMFYSSVKSRGPKFIFNLIQSNAKNGTLFSHVIYTIIMEWVGLVAKKINIPSTLFWVQPTTSFDVYYYRFTDYSDYFKNYDAKDKIIELPVRVNVSEGGFVERDEFNRCITIVMGDGEEGEELRRNVQKWSDLAKEAMKENGTSSGNLKAFANEILLGHNEY